MNNCIANAIRNLCKRVHGCKRKTISQSNIREAIFNQICYTLPNLYDKSVFRTTSYERLGKLYFDHIHSSVDCANDDIIQEVIRMMSPSTSQFSQQRDYWIALTNLVHLKELPCNVYVKLEKEYSAVYRTKYQNVKNKLNAKLCLLNSEISRLERERESIKNKICSNRSITYDITSDEDRYRRICSDHNRISTRKAQLLFLSETIFKKLDDFRKIDDSDAQVDVWLRKKSINIAILGGDVETLFLPYISFLSILESDIDNERFILNQVKILALVDIYREKQHKALCIADPIVRQNTINECIAKMQTIPNSDDLSVAYAMGRNDYLEKLDCLISKFDVTGRIIDDINNSITLRTRKSLLNDVLSLYINGSYTLFNCIAPMQIEGLFADFLYAASTFNRFTDMDLFERDVLNVKLEKLALCSEVDIELVEYFGFYFTNIVRNRAAHGRYTKPSDAQDDEILAKELLLDMKCITRQIRRKAEVEKMLRYVQEYSNMSGITSSKAIYGALYGDLTGQRIHLSYDSLEQHNPIQFLYWIINPYYEKYSKLCRSAMRLGK